MSASENPFKALEELDDTEVERMALRPGKETSEGIQTAAVSVGLLLISVMSAFLPIPPEAIDPIRNLIPPLVKGAAEIVPLILVYLNTARYTKSRTELKLGTIKIKQKTS